MPIRPRQPSDLDACVTILRRVYETSGYPGRWPADPAGFLSSAGLIAAWVAEQDGAVAGQVGLVQRDQPACLLEATGREASQIAEVIRLYVDPAAWGSGLGGGLLAAACEYAVASGLRPVLRVVEGSGPAIALYERTGWRLAGSATATWSTPEGDHPVILYYVSP